MWAAVARTSDRDPSPPGSRAQASRMSASSVAAAGRSARSRKCSRGFAEVGLLSGATVAREPSRSVYTNAASYRANRAVSSACNVAICSAEPGGSVSACRPSDCG